jgi:hypothetical protein
MNPPSPQLVADLYLSGTAIAEIETQTGCARRMVYVHLRAAGLSPSRSDRSDLAGRRFGRLVVEGLHGKSPRGQTLWLCRCDCGNGRVADRAKLTRHAYPADACVACTWKRLGRAA